MNSLTHFKKILILPLLIVLALVALASPTVARADAVTDWNQIASDTLVAFPGPAGGAPSALQLNMGMTQGAVYDALNAIEPRYQPYLLEERFDPGASKEAATATAAPTLSRRCLTASHFLTSSSCWIHWPLNTPTRSMEYRMARPKITGSTRGTPQPPR